MIAQIGMITLASLLAAFSAELKAQEPGLPAVEGDTGLTVGTPAPKFSLKDQSGTERSLDEFLGNNTGKVALVFYRSADW